MSKTWYDKTLPGLLSAREVSCGAILKHATNGRKAVVVEYLGTWCLAVTAKDWDKVEDDEVDYCPTEPEHYTIFKIEEDDASNWIVLEPGYDYCIVD